MTLQTAAGTFIGRTRGHRPAFAALGAALVLTAAGVSAWAVAGHRTAPAAPTAQGQMSAAPAAPIAADHVRQEPAAPVFYLVGSQAQDDALQDALANTPAMAPPPSISTLVVASDAERDWLMRALADLEGMRAGVGMPSVQVVDLRPRDRATDAVPVVRGTAPQLTTVYVTTSAEQAQNRVTNELGAAPAAAGEHGDPTLVVTNPDGVVGSWLLAFLGSLPGSRVSDLR